MPKESLSVYLAAVDGMSPVLASITDKTKALDKESQELRETYLRAAQVGQKYNVPAESIQQILRSIPGLKRFEAEAAEGAPIRSRTRPCTPAWTRSASAHPPAATRPNTGSGR